ncbi:PAS domain-containing protein [Dactylosporangium vinaceum]|uniref:LuxR family transcriptional regulator n=1 Tax=Dactylosporangium matsuzakiense TaxID=53360 RepID=A0A9W6KXP7_9ACTN|nr:PAS domain-containing protein [Dactylosporangium vinaceum]GLL08481.1 hypothetical protein GCM10017581_102460 [Dactylosporangium matsuzakiense]
MPLHPALVAASEYGELFLTIVERTGVGLVLLNPQLRIQQTNAAFLEHCGQPRFDLHGFDFPELLHPSVRQYMRRQFDRLLTGRSNRFVEHLAALWATRTAFTGALTGMAVPSEAGPLKTIVVLVSPDKAEDDERRVLISPNKILSEINAKILEGVATGVPTVQLAARLYLSRQGIEYHVSNMLRQFKVPNRAALVSKAYSMGLFGVGSWPPKVLPEYVRR